MKATFNTHKLDEVMNILYHNYGKKGIGVSEEMYKATIESVSGTSMDWLFDQYINGTKAFDAILTDCFEYLGLELMNEPSLDYAAARIGVKVGLVNTQLQAMAIYPGGSYDVAGGMLGDEIIAINDLKINNDLNQWLSFFENSSTKLTVNRKGKLHDLFLPGSNNSFYHRFWIQKRDHLSDAQMNALRSWRE